MSQAGGKYIPKEVAHEIICNGVQMLRDGKTREEAKSAVVTCPHDDSWSSRLRFVGQCQTDVKVVLLV